METEKIKISIIIPVYNLAEELPKCLDSVLRQTHEDLEIITVDDGSVDESGKILDDYAMKDQRIKVIHKENGGVSSARNAGLDIASGDYIGFVDGDDLIDRDMFEFLLKNAVENEAEISHCGMQIIAADGSVKKFYGTGKKRIQDCEDSLFDLMSGKEIEPTNCNKLFLSELFDDVRYDRDIRYNEDFLINVRLFLKAKKTVYEDLCKYSYVRREGSASKGNISEKLIFDPINVRKTIIRLVKDRSDKLRTIAAESYIHSLISGYTAVICKGGKKLAGEKKRIRKMLFEVKDNIKTIPPKSRAHAYLIMYAPVLCKPVFGVYYALFDKSVYG